ncbi:MAG TPA: antitoxin Xre/MbcA/ParS toxin-binding domain-containing protein [Thermoanaerobaculia bacterium]|nr:antitoxin Xre/MbcA/ParS toxin-binding domain-containing protein [Thermoanaerobaculia bacterium]
MSPKLAIVEVLGGQKILHEELGSSLDLTAWIRRGLPYSSLESLRKRFRLRRTEISSALGLPQRTLARRRQERRLSPAESDRLVRMARIAAMAVAVLGTEDKASLWLHRPNRALGGEMPLALLDTDLGAREVEQVLGRIEQGIHS